MGWFVGLYAEGITQADTVHPFVRSSGFGRTAPQEKPLYLVVPSIVTAPPRRPEAAGETARRPLVPGGPGHGCGHNMLGAAAFAAACGVKRFLERSGLPGTVVFYGCPGEEGGAAKAFLARDGVWKDLDAALAWHPGDTNEITTGTNNS